MPLFIVRDDITKMSVDAIVNAANNSLLGGGGVDGAIHAAAGPKLLEECKTLGGCSTGEAKVTKAYLLNAKYIIHTIGPIYHDGKHGEPLLLASCYEKSLNLAKDLQCSSIAFPQISTGVYGYPKDDAFRIAKNVITSFLEQNDMDVYIVIYNKQPLNENGNRNIPINEYYHLRKSATDERYYVKYNSEIEHKRNKKYNEILSNFCTIRAEESDEKDSRPISNDYIGYKPHDDRILGSVPPFDYHLDDGFSDTLFSIINKKKLDPVQVYKESNINRKHFSKINSDKNYKPKKMTVLSFCIGLHATLEEAELLLKSAGFAFSNAIAIDQIIKQCIDYRFYDIYKINEYLFDNDLELLGQKCD